MGEPSGPLPGTQGGEEKLSNLLYIFSKHLLHDWGCSCGVMGKYEHVRPSLSFRGLNLVQAQTVFTAPGPLLSLWTAHPGHHGSSSYVLRHWAMVSPCLLPSGPSQAPAYHEANRARSRRVYEHKGNPQQAGRGENKANAGLNPTCSTTWLSGRWSTLCGILGNISCLPFHSVTET